MKVGLFHKGIRHSFEFDPSAQKWKTQNGEFLVGVPTKLPGDLSFVFVKRWKSALAPAHRLLLATIQQPLPRAPQLLGHAVQRQDHIYFMQNLGPPNVLLEKLINGKGPGIVHKLTSALLKRNFGLSAITAAATLFEEINERGWVYPDFTHKNIMVNGKTGQCTLIDIDSCFPASELKPVMSASGFSQAYWGAWRERLRVKTAETLSRSMILSFAAVWARAAAMLRASYSVIDVQRELLNPSFPKVQAGFWDSLLKSDRAAFRNYFVLADESDADKLFLQWQTLVTELDGGKLIPWPRIVELATATFTAAQTLPVVDWVPPVVDPFEEFAADPLTAALVGNGASYFITKWRKEYNRSGAGLASIATRVSFNGAAFLLGPAYLAYRRLFVLSAISTIVICFSLVMIQPGGAAAAVFALNNVVLSLIANSRVFARVEFQRRKLIATLQTQAAQLHRARATSSTSIIAASVVFALLIIAVLGRPA